MASGNGNHEAGFAAAEVALKVEEQQQETERQAQLDAIIVEAVSADGWAGDYKKNAKKKTEHLQDYIAAVKARPTSSNEARNIFRGSRKKPVFKDVATAERFNAFLNKIDAVYGVSKKVQPEPDPVPATSEPAPATPEPAKATAPVVDTAPDKGKEAEAEFRSLQDQFSASVRGYAKKDKTFRAAPDARSATEYWLRAKRSGIDVQTHPFFDRMIGDKAAFATFADGIDDLDKRRIQAKNDTGGNWRVDFGKGPRANDSFERTVDDELVATRVRAIEGFANQETRALGEQAVFAKLDAEARKAKLKPIVELLATEKRPATDDEAKSLVGETGPVEEMKALLWELGHIETERERVKAAFQSVRDGSKKKDTAAVADAGAAAKSLAKGPDAGPDVGFDMDAPFVGDSPQAKIAPVSRGKKTPDAIAPAVTESEPVMQSIDDVADNKEIWIKAWFNSNDAAVRRGVVHEALLRVKIGEAMDEVLGDLSVLRKFRPVLGEALQRLADALPDTPPPPDVAPMFKLVEEMRAEIEAEIASATTAADTDAYYHKIVGLKIRGVSGDELKAVEDAAGEKWNSLMHKDINSRLIDVLNQTNTPDEARALLATIDELKTTWSFSDKFKEKLVKEVNDVIADREALETAPPAFPPLPDDAFDSAPPAWAAPTGPEAAPFPPAPSATAPEAAPSPETAAAEAKVNELIDQATSREDLHDVQALLESYYDDGTLTFVMAGEFQRQVNAKWDAVATPKEKARDRINELDIEVDNNEHDLMRLFATDLDPVKRVELFNELSSEKIDGKDVVAQGVMKAGVTAEEVDAAAAAFIAAYDARKAAKADLAAMEKAERPGVFDRIGGWFKGKPKAEAATEAAPAAPSAPVVDTSPFSPDKIKAKDLLSGDFWKYLGKQADIRWEAYKKGELTESERKGEKQAWGWTVARLGLETAGSVSGARVFVEQARYKHTNKEYDRLLEAMESAEAPEKDPAGADIAASAAVIEDHITKALEASNHLSDAKKAELVPKLTAALEKVRTATRFHKEEVEKAQAERDRQIALLLDEALQLKVRKLARNREAINSAIALATFGSAHLFSGVSNVGLRLGRTGFMMAASNLERMVRLRSERVQGGNLAELSKTQFAKDAVMGVVRGFQENLTSLAGGGLKNWGGLLEKGQRLESAGKIVGNFGAFSLTILKYYGISHAFAADAPGSEHAEVSLKAAETQLAAGAVPEAPHDSVLFEDQPEAQADDFLHPGLAGSVEVAEPEVDQAPDSMLSMTPEEYHIANEQRLEMGTEGMSVLGGVDNVQKWGTVEAGDGFTRVLARQIEHAGPDTLKAMHFNGDAANEEAVHLFAVKKAFEIAQENGRANQWLSGDSIGKNLVLTDKGDGHYGAVFADLKNPEADFEVGQMVMEPVHAAPDATEHAVAPSIDTTETASVWTTTETSSPDADREVESPWGAIEPQEQAQVVWGTTAENGEPVWGQLVTPEPATVSSEIESAVKLFIDGKVVEPPADAYTPEELDKLAVHAAGLEKLQKAELDIHDKIDAYLKEKGVGDSGPRKEFERMLGRMEDHREKDLGRFLSRLEDGNQAIADKPLLPPLNPREMYAVAFAEINTRISATHVTPPMDKVEWLEFQRKIVSKAA